MNRLRLLPIVLIAVSALFVLKTGGIVFRGGYLFEPVGPAHAQEQAAQETPAEDDGAGSPGERADAPEDEAAMDGGEGATEGALPGNAIDGRVKETAREVRPGEDVVGAKAAILERLTSRRGELDERARQLDMRENLLKAAERRIEDRIAALEKVEARIVSVEEKRKEEKRARLEGLITMYENMKPKDAARIFNQLDMDVLVDLVEQMNARTMAGVLAEMDSDAAERLTLAIAARARSQQGDTMSMNAAGGEGDGSELPKIEGTRSN